MSDKAEDIAPPFQGFIANTYDALLVFEAARRGMIPRVTRRLNDTERSMVQSGSVFVYDEQESGIKRWTDGHSWSPSRILANFLVYRETVKQSDNKDAKDGEDGVKKEPGASRPVTRDGRPQTANSSPGNGSPIGTDGSMSAYAESSRMAMEAAARPLAHGQMRPRSAAEAGGCRLENGYVIDRHLERKLVGSLTNSYLFQPGGLVKKTMTLTISGFHQHVVSYYTLEDAVAGRLRRPSSIPEFAALEISPEYLTITGFRYPPSIEMGLDGIPRYRGEPEDRPGSPSRQQQPYIVGELYADPYATGLDHQPRMRSLTAPTPTISTAFSPTQPSYIHPGSAPGYYDSQPMHVPTVPRVTAAIRGSNQGSRRYEPYGGSQHPRVMHQSMPQGMDSGHQRRLSQPPVNEQGGYYPPSEYSYQPPSSAPSAFAYYSPMSATQPQQPQLPSPVSSSPSYGGQYAAWHPPPAANVRTLPMRPDLLDHPPPSSSGSLDSAPGSSSAPHVMSSEWATGMPPPSAAAPIWDNHPPPMTQPYAVQQGDGWQVGLA